MKKILSYTTIACIALMVLSSCDKWLEATSSTQLPMDKLFDTREGFHNALTGVYIGLGSSGAYGADYTWKVNDIVSYPYAVVQSSDFEPWQTHKYTGLIAKNEIDYMWSEGYNVIVNINAILREMENRREVLSYEPEYNLMRGELLALRAYVHFDLMKMFGTADWNGENASKKAIPYLTVYDKEPVEQLSYEKTVELLLKDVEEAIECLTLDPITGNTPNGFDSIVNADGFWNNRTKRMNYYAANALAARIYQWKKEYDKAAEYATAVIEGALDSGVVSWVDIEGLHTALSDDYRDWTFSTEHLFSLEIMKLNSYTMNWLMTNKDFGVYLPLNYVDNVFFVADDPETGSVAGAEDIRGPGFLMRYGYSGYFSLKLFYSTNYSDAFRNRMPMIKISEMYYIIAEKYISEGDNESALKALDEVRKHRGISDVLASTADASKVLLLEYYREFMCEGQTFYYLKHSGKKYDGAGYTLEELTYPYPYDETTYGRVQEL